MLDGVTVLEALLRVGSLLRLGKTVIRFELGTEMNRLPLSEDTQDDCNLVIYDGGSIYNSGGSAIWATWTFCR